MKLKIAPTPKPSLTRSDLYKSSTVLYDYFSWEQTNLLQPSTAAMRTAQERAKHWAAEDDALFLEPQDDTTEKTLRCRGISTPGSARCWECFTSGVQAGGGGTFRSVAHFSIQSTPGSRSLQATSNSFMKTFKCLLLNPPATRNSESSQHTVALFNTVAFTPTKGPKAAALDAFSCSGSGFSSPIPKGTPMRKVSAKNFVTPSCPECDRWAGTQTTGGPQ
ncbi:hypothetical protein BGY98DRAFT_1118391 [Russula aff. rugulosa BPL654]|nr:hypothetical protein BGY98DRAFT_1118391 [Russula aff. rugulosa BPL654]